jgi:threonine/homoserine/homoserine lactone efflux protein
LGAAVAEGIYAGVAFWGFATFLARWRLVIPISGAVSGILLITLGVRFVFWRPAKAETREDRRAGTALLGFSISVLNPTLVVTWSAIVAFLYSRGLDEAAPALAVPFGLSAGAGVAMWFVCLVSLLRSFRRRLPQAAFRWAIRTAGLALIVLGIVATVKFVRWVTHAGDHAARSGQASVHGTDRDRTNRTILAG